MNAPPPDLPPGLQWLSWTQNVLNLQFLGWSLWVVGALLVVAGNAVVLLLGAWIEWRHDRRLTMMEGAVAAVRLFTGRPPADVRGVPQLVQAAIVMSPAPLGRLMLLIRRIIGGRVVTRQRDQQRLRRLALLRLREQAQRAGAGVVAGVEFCQIAVGRGRFAMLATGTALIGSAPSPRPAVTEAIGAQPPRRRRELILALVGMVLVTGLAVWFNYLSEAFFGDLWRRWILHVKR